MALIEATFESKDLTQSISPNKIIDANQKMVIRTKIIWNSYNVPIYSYSPCKYLIKQNDIYYCKEVAEKNVMPNEKENFAKRSTTKFLETSTFQVCKRIFPIDTHFLVYML